MEATVASRAMLSPGTVWVTALKNLWRWSLRSATVRKTRRLRVCETLSLGERRFLAVIEFDNQEFLVGGTGNSLQLMERLSDRKVVAAGSRAQDAVPNWNVGGLY